MPVADMFWGDRAGTVSDPFGHQWTIATHKEDVPPEEIQRRFDPKMSPADREHRRSRWNEALQRARDWEERSTVKAHK